MPLTAAQQTTLAADIAADPTLGPLPQTPDNAVTVATAYNANASPDYWVWRTDTLTLIQIEVFRLMLGNGGFNAADPNVRQGLQDIFAGPAQATTRANLVALAKRLATRAEQLFATGAGTNADPSTMSFEGTLHHQDVLAAWGV